MKRFIVHGRESFYPGNSYTVDTDLADTFTELGYSTIVEEPTQDPATFNEVVEIETKVEKEKRKRKGQD